MGKVVVITTAIITLKLSSNDNPNNTEPNILTIFLVEISDIQAMILIKRLLFMPQPVSYSGLALITGLFASMLNAYLIQTKFEKKGENDSY